MTQHFNLSKKDIDEFKYLYYKAYKIDLSDEKAEQEAIKLLEFMSFIFYEKR